VLGAAQAALAEVPGGWQFGLVTGIGGGAIALIQGSLNLLAGQGPCASLEASLGILGVASGAILGLFGAAPPGGTSLAFADGGTVTVALNGEVVTTLSAEGILSGLIMMAKTGATPRDPDIVRVQGKSDTYQAFDRNSGELLGTAYRRGNEMVFDYDLENKDTQVTGITLWQKLYNALATNENTFISDGAPVTIHDTWIEDNLDAFNKAIKNGATPEQAGWRTFDGLMAKFNKFTHINLDSTYLNDPDLRNPDGTYKGMSARFSK
jgi:hypothetical protein